MGALFEDRARADSFGTVAHRYDRYRPSYPSALVDDLVAPGPHDVLDIGCGTGKAAVLLAARGLDVIGVEPDERMAAVARRHGLAVDVATFELWEPGRRRFDLITCAQAWHWIDPSAGTVKVAGLLRPGATFAPFWNYDTVGVSTQAVLDVAYAAHAPELLGPHPAPGTGARVAAESVERHAAALRASGLFATVEARRYPWSVERTGADWVAMTGTHSDHLQLDPARRERLFAAVSEVVDAHGGSVTSEYVTYALLARG